MCDKQLLSVQKTVLSVSRRQPEIALQRTEEVLFPFQDNVVSVWYLSAQKRIVSSCLLNVSEKI
jgi:hypothetical protein